MTEREQTIAQAFAEFKRHRRLRPEDLVSEWIDAVLVASGQPRMTGDEGRLVRAHVDCGWQVPYEPREFDEVDRFIQAKPVRRPAPRTLF